MHIGSSCASSPAVQPRALIGRLRLPTRLSSNTFSKSPHTPRDSLLSLGYSLYDKLPQIPVGVSQKIMFCYPSQTAYHGPVHPYPILPSDVISDESGTLFPVTGVPVTPTFTPPNSTVRLLPTSDISNGNISNNTHLFTPVDTAFNFPAIPAVPILPGTSQMPLSAESREKGGLQDWPRQYTKSRKKASIPQFSCDECGAKYAQQQGLNRHHREKHNPSLCMFCDAAWGRTYEYGDHLKRHHPDVDCDVVLGKPAGSRRRSACLARQRPPQVLFPTLEHGRLGHAGITDYPPAAVKLSTVAIPLLDTYVPEPEYSQPVMTSKDIFEGERVSNDLDSSSYLLGGPQVDSTKPVRKHPNIMHHGSDSQL